MTLHRPETLEAALSLLGPGAPVILAGGTDVYPGLRDAPAPAEMIDITGVVGLRGIDKTAEGWRIGAATTWSDILRADLPPLFDGLRAAAREVGSVQIQTTGTVAGNICNASPAADGVPPLLSLDAEVELCSARGRRRLPLGDFILGPRRTARAGDELVTALLIPDSAGQGAFLKLGARRYLVISIAMVAATLRMEGGRIAEARIAVGACSPVARRLPALEAALSGCPVAQIPVLTESAELEGIAPIDDVRATASYRLDALRTLIARTLVAAADPESRHVA